MELLSFSHLSFAWSDYEVNLCVSAHLNAPDQQKSKTSACILVITLTKSEV